MSIQEEIKHRKLAKQDPFPAREGKFKYAGLEDSFYHLNWAEETFLSGNYEKEMLRRTFDLSKLKYIIGLIIALFLVLLVRVFWLQVIRGDYYYSLAEVNRIRVERLEPKRGIIYDRNLKSLVRNEANFVLYLIPNELPKDERDRDEYLRQISGILDDASSGEVEKKISKVGDLELIPENSSFFMIKNKLDKVNLKSMDAYQPLFILDNIDYQKALALNLKTQGLPGVFISNKIRRNYLIESSTSTPAGINGVKSLSHILGYTGKINEAELKATGPDYSLIDYIGKTGVEYTYEKELKGIIGKKNIEVDALGREKKIISQSAPVDGHNLRLSLDLGLQKKSEEIVADIAHKLGVTRASVIVMDPRNGEILSLVSWPGYDNNVFSRGIKTEEYSKLLNDKDRPLFNRAISGDFPAGSTIKPVMSAAALQEKVINENTSFMSSGGVRIGQWFFPDWKAGGHGTTNVRKAIAESVNTFFYIIGGGFENFKGLGIDRIIKYFDLFGLGEELGIDLPNESTGFLPTPEWKADVKNEVWYIGDTYHVSIGQGDLLTTPLQVAEYTSFFANGGKLYKPHLVKEILDSDNNVVRKIEPEIIRQKFIDPGNIEIVRQGMRQTITAGSARSLGTLSVPVAGKTGTAQWSSVRPNQAWFTGFAPYDNPEVVITVLMEEGGEGSTAAVPVVHQILDYYFNPNKVASSSVENLAE
jgi:penicillin-binding protein 2